MKKVLSMLLVLLCLASSALAQNGRVFDNAGLFSKEDIAEIEQAISDFQIKTDFAFVVLTTDDYLGFKNFASVAESFYIAEKFGFDRFNSGMLYYIDMNQRYPYVSTHGKMVTLFESTMLLAAHDACHPFLASGQYKQAVLKMIECATNAVLE